MEGVRKFLAEVDHASLARVHSTVADLQTLALDAAKTGTRIAACSQREAPIRELIMEAHAIQMRTGEMLTRLCEWIDVYHPPVEGLGTADDRFRAELSSSIDRECVRASRLGVP